MKTIASTILIITFLLCNIALASPVPQRPGIGEVDVNPKIERELRHNSATLYRKLGIYRIMRRAKLQNISGGEQAWCAGRTVENEKAGCYIEFYYTKAQYNSTELWEKNNLCGVDARFYARWDQPNHYVPDSGGARWLRKGDLRAVLFVVNDQWRMCVTDAKYD